MESCAVAARSGNSVGGSGVHSKHCKFGLCEANRRLVCFRETAAN